MIEIRHLTKSFGRVTAVNDASFEVRKGEIVGLLGPNGAGKTTTMQILASYIPATGGQVFVDGLDVFTESLEVRRRIGYLPENVPLYRDMRVREYLRYRGRLKGLHGKRLRVREGEVMEQCGLTDVDARIIGQLSRGYRQRVGLADSLLHEPELLILDEPTVGLDPNQIRQMRNLIQSLADRHTVLLASHILPEVEMICERVLIMNGGCIAASDTPGNLVGLLRGHRCFAVELQGADRESIQRRLERIPGIVKVRAEDQGDWHRFLCDSEDRADVREAIFQAAASSRWSLRELKEERKNLEDVFVAMTRNGGLEESS